MAYNFAGTGRFDLADSKNPQDPNNDMNVLVKTEDGDPISIPKMVWAKGQGQNSESFGTDPERERNEQRLEDYLYQGNLGGQGQQSPITDDIRNRFLTEDERRSEFAQAAHPTSLMMSNPLSAFMMNDQGQMGGPETWFKNLGKIGGTDQMSNAAPDTEYLNQFMGIPFASGLPGSTPDNRIPVAPAMNPGSKVPEPLNRPDNYQDYAGHSKQEMPAFNGGLMGGTSRTGGAAPAGAAPAGGGGAGGYPSLMDTLGSITNKKKPIVTEDEGLMGAR